METEWLLHHHNAFKVNKVIIKFPNVLWFFMPIYTYFECCCRTHREKKGFPAMLAVSASSSLATAEPCGISTVLYLFSLISGLWVRIIIVKKWVSSPHAYRSSFDSRSAPLAGCCMIGTHPSIHRYSLL